MIKKSINLVQNRTAPPTIWEKIYNWANGTCRTIVVITSLCVLLAFGLRFFFERKKEDLNDEIEIKVRVIQNLQDQEKEIRNFQARISKYEKIWNSSSNLTPYIKEIQSYFPSDLTEIDFSLQKKDNEEVNFYLSGKCSKESIEDLEKKLKNSNSFKNVLINSIEKKNDTYESFTFSLSANLNSKNSREE